MSVWRELLRAVTAPPAAAQPAARPHTASTDSGFTPPVGWGAPTPMVPYPATADTVVLGGRIDAAECGGYSLSWYVHNTGMQLKLFAGTRDQRLSGFYELAGIPVDRWFGLLESRGIELPVAVCWTGADMRVRVEADDLPAGIPRIRPDHP